MAHGRDICDVRPFDPHPWVRGGHAQTIVGRMMPTFPVALRFKEWRLDADAGDRLSVLETIPEGWNAGGPAAILVHGLAGCARSPYMVRTAARLARLGVRTVRMNLRGAGSGFGLARKFYHAGRIDDVRRVAAWLADRAAGSPIALVGFSLGASLVLRLAGEASAEPVAGLDCVVAANPPLDLASCCRHISRPENRIYDRNFVRLLHSEVTRLHAEFPELGPVALESAQTLYAFDDVYTAPRNGFRNAEDYYEKSSAGPWVPRITVGGLVVHAEDDPFIPSDVFRSLTFPSALALELISSGGHLGYFSRTRWGGDRRWLEARLAAWLARRWGIPSTGHVFTMDGRPPVTVIPGRQDDHARPTVQ